MTRGADALKKQVLLRCFGVVVQKKQKKTIKEKNFVALPLYFFS